MSGTGRKRLTKDTWEVNLQRLQQQSDMKAKLQVREEKKNMFKNTPELLSIRNSYIIVLEPQAILFSYEHAFHFCKEVAMSY